MVKKIVLTGGPSSGKTTVIGKIKEKYEAQGYKVILVDETATYLILKGIKPFGDDAIDLVDFQELVMKLQLAKEEVLSRACEMYPEDTKIIMVFDRGALDNHAYVNDEEFSDVLSRLEKKTNIQKLLDNYDLIINLVGSKEFYTTENNEARSEDSDEAQRLGEQTLKSWLGHPKLKIVLPKEKMEDKIREVLNIINELLSERQVKRQEKYVVDLKNTDMKRIIEKGKKYSITQDYLSSPENVEKRLRKVESQSDVTYYLSVFRINDKGEKTIVSEKEISRKVYEELLSFRKEGTKTIRKTRYYFAESNEFSLDIFEGDDELGVLEVNVGQDEKVAFPSYVSILENVTNNPAYLNINMARENNKQYKKANHDVNPK